MDPDPSVVQDLPTQDAGQQSISVRHRPIPQNKLENGDLPDLQRQIWGW